MPFCAALILTAWIFFNAQYVSIGSTPSTTGYPPRCVPAQLKQHMGSTDIDRLLHGLQINEKQQMFFNLSENSRIVPILRSDSSHVGNATIKINALPTQIRCKYSNSLLRCILCLLNNRNSDSMQRNQSANDVSSVQEWESYHSSKISVQLWTKSLPYVNATKKQVNPGTERTKSIIFWSTCLVTESQMKCLISKDQNLSRCLRKASLNQTTPVFILCVPEQASQLYQLNKVIHNVANYLDLFIQRNDDKELLRTNMEFAKHFHPNDPSMQNLEKNIGNRHIKNEIGTAWNKQKQKDELFQRPLQNNSGKQTFFGNLTEKEVIRIIRALHVSNANRVQSSIRRKQPWTSRKLQSRYLRSASHDLHSDKVVNYPITFRNSDAYLVVPAVRLYDRFRLRFSVRTTQSDGLILFNPGPFAVDFIAFELSRGHLHVNFDMGSGVQRHGLLATRVDDNRWHQVELIREDTDQNVLTLFMDRGSHIESRLDIKVLHGERSKNFNFADYLYVGGIPRSVTFKWRERLRILHGFQGCLCNFSVNEQPAIDLLRKAKEVSSHRTGSMHLTNADVIAGCLDRPSGAPQCPVETRYQRLYESGSNQTLPRTSHEAYCMNDGICLLMWSSLKCDCELTSFQGSRCSQTGTTLGFGIRPNSLPPTTFPTVLTNTTTTNTSAASIGYLRLTYTDQVRNTHQEEFVVGVQITGNKQAGDQTNAYKKSNQIETLIFVTNTAQTGDYFHLYLQSGFVRLDCDFGGGPMRIVGPELRVNDGFYHRIRGFRLNFRLVLEVDQLQSVYHLKGRYGKQFNGQETIWLGHAPSLNRTDFYQGFMSGIYYNGVLLSDIAAGLTYLPFIHVTRYANVEHVDKFEAALSPASPFRSRTDKYNDELQKDQKHSQFTVDGATAQQNTVGSNTQADAQIPQQPAPVTPGLIHQGYPVPDNIRPQLVTDFTSEEASHGRSTIHDQVNIWLVICLAGAGCIMLASLTILVYRFHFKRVTCCQSTRRTARTPKWNPVHQSNSDTLRSNDNLPHLVSGFHDDLPCSPVLLPLTNSELSKHGSPLVPSIGSSYKPTMTLMMPNSLLKGTNEKTSSTVTATCCPVHLQTVPTSLVYFNGETLVPTAVYQPWRQSLAPSEDRASSISPHSTNSSPVVDLIKPGLGNELDVTKIVTDVEVCGMLSTNRSQPEPAPSVG